MTAPTSFLFLLAKFRVILKKALCFCGSPVQNTLEEVVTLGERDPTIVVFHRGTLRETKRAILKLYFGPKTLRLSGHTMVCVVRAGFVWFFFPAILK